MTGWQMGWTIILTGAVLLFLVVEVVVIIGGAWNIRDMLRSLRQARAESEEERA